MASFCACSGMNVAVDYAVRIIEDRFCLVGKDNFNIGTAFTDKVAVILNVVNTGKLVLSVAEKLAVFFKRENIGIGIDSGFVHLIEADEMVADLVGRIAEHKNYLLAALCNAAKRNCKTVTGSNREYNSDCLAAELCFNVCRYIINCAVVALCTGYY